MTNLNDNVGFWDSVLIENLTEETFISNIYQRYKRGLIYTYIGAFLVAINPYKAIANYSTDTIQCYAKSNYFKLPPHIYGITNASYRSLQDQNENQCMCILGENGSGKTESARIILHFLSNVHSDHTLSGKKILHNQNSTRLMRCKSLASYPKYESLVDGSCRSKKRDSIKFARKAHKSSGTVEFDLRNQYKSLDDVSLNSICDDNKWNPKISRSVSSAINTPKAKCSVDQINCDEKRRWSAVESKALQCDRTPTRKKNFVVMKKDLQCDKCGYIKSICDDNNDDGITGGSGISNTSTGNNNTKTNNRCSKGTSCHLSDEHFSTNYFKDNATIKCTNYKLKSGSTYSLSRSSSFINSSDIHLTIRRRIVYAQVLLEAFGNASIPLNSNSSRFGNFFDIELDFKGDPLAAHINCYMIEKWRVTDRLYGERNFHIFYQLLCGADIAFLKYIKLQRNSEKYALLKNDPATNTDREDFAYTKKALDVIGLTSDEILSIFKMVSIILKLGNLIFIPTTNIDGSGGCEITNDYEVIEIAEIAQLNPNILMNCLTKGDHNWRYNDSDSDLDALSASRIRNAMCRTIYGRLFTWIAGKINESLKIKHGSLHGKNFGILDFFGFEINKTNRFEQLVNNYCSERLHQSFLQNIFKNQQEIYLKEGLDWNKIDFFDNYAICDLIDKTNYGILNLLDEPHIKSDEAFLLRVQQCCAGNPNFLPEDNNMLRKSFQIRHFAGQVSYSATGFMEKNADKVPRYISTGLFHSKLPLMQSLFPEGNPNRTHRHPASISSNIQMQLQSLLSLIKDRKTHYIFCIKPNELKKANLFELPLVQHQIRYTNIMPLVNIWRMGYCFNLSHLNFLNRYKILSPETWPFYQIGSVIEGIATIIRELPLPSAEFILGTTKVFMRSPRTVFEMEEFRRNRLNELIVIIQTKFRSYIQRKRFLRLKHCQITIARTWRAQRAKEKQRMLRYRKMSKWAVNIIENYYIRRKKRQFLMTLMLRLPSTSYSPISNEWITAPPYLAETSCLLRSIFHKWRCYKYRRMYDQVARNRMREKLTASVLFKNRKTSYPLSIPHPFLGDYVRLRQNVQWKKLCISLNDQYIVFADIVSKITRSTGKVAPILMALSTNAMLLLDQRTLQIKYRIPATEIYRLSLSPYHDNIAVFHIKDSEMGRKKGDFVFQTAHVIEVITKLFLVIQNATGRQPEICIDSEFDVMFSNQSVTLSFKLSAGLNDAHAALLSPHVKITRKSDRMEIVI
ncbi:unconventional myosin-Ia isoform X2 [Contarinia nasturtii]|uniref:unconventional myosin-Ia isoform X2 n=1 Tax=Contarinia nasturtii TaxID=265458 RepID=UPI0012D41B9B|nr:unconventional myosin-Ia isoform X2 [Contarinia nasturtii]